MFFTSSRTKRTESFFTTRVESIVFPATSTSEACVYLFSGVYISTEHFDCFGAPPQAAIIRSRAAVVIICVILAFVIL